MSAPTTATMATRAIGAEELASCGFWSRFLLPTFSEKTRPAPIAEGQAMHDYDVIVRIPIRARDMGSACELAADIVALDLKGDAELVSVECTGPAEEVTNE